jgi:leucyl aminopeptidase
MEVQSTTRLPGETDADTVAIGVFEGEGVAHDTGEAALAALLAAGEARPAFRSLAATHADGKRWLLVGLGERDALTPERARTAAAVAHERAREMSTQTLCWEVPHHVGAEIADALVQGTVLAGYRFERFRREPPQEPAAVQRLLISAHDDLEQVTAEAAMLSEAVNAARDLQNMPGNHLTPTALGERARALASEVDGLTAEVVGREQIVALGMGAFAAVAQGTYQEPALITLRYDGPTQPGGEQGPVLGLVGKGVTFDSGGISLKPGAKMSEMKFDMSGAAAVLEATGAIARLGLPIRLVSVIGATENLPSGRSVKPGDVVTARNGLTIEINNTDAEGRLVLADCICHALDQGAERLVDVATLTGAIVIALGSTHAGLMSNDDDLARQLQDAGAHTGELVWRMPLHEEYAELIKGHYADLDNAPEDRKAGSIVGAEFLHRFAGDVPWAHVDIAGMAWNLGRAYAQRGGSGYGVRLLVELARGQATPAA